MRHTPPAPRSRPGRHASALLLAAFAMLAGAGCDESFSPIEASDLHYSVFGYLDAAADTQWIRVMPLRTLVLEPPRPLSARVTLERLGTGQVIELRDSIFQFDRVDPDLGSGGLFLHNFWTTERIEPGAAYRFSIMGADGSSAETLIQLPPDFEVEVWRRQNPTQLDLFHLIGLKHVALVGTNSYYVDKCGPAVDYVSYTLTAIDSAFHRIPPFPPISTRSGCDAPRVYRRELWVAGSGAKWPERSELRDAKLNVSDALTTVSGSVGFVGGVLVRRVPSEACQLVVPFGAPTVHCVLRYNASTAVLSGTVEDATCGGPASGVPVQLREIVPPQTTYRVRPTATGESGEFEISALEAGRRYALSIRQVVAGIDLFEEYGDTLELAPGEHRTYHARVRRIERCPATP